VWHLQSILHPFDCDKRATHLIETLANLCTVPIDAWRCTNEGNHSRGSPLGAQLLELHLDRVGENAHKVAHCWLLHAASFVLLKSTQQIVGLPEKQKGDNLISQEHDTYEQNPGTSAAFSGYRLSEAPVAIMRSKVRSKSASLHLNCCCCDESAESPIELSNSSKRLQIGRKCCIVSKFC